MTLGNDLIKSLHTPQENVDVQLITKNIHLTLMFIITA
jgi:hypothetical protein